MEFWITTVGTVASVLGLVFSILAFREATQAKKAAEAAQAASKRAGKIVRNLTIGNELGEVMTLLRDLKRQMSWDDARDLLNRISQTIVRYTASVQNNADLKIKFDEVKTFLSNAENALDDVKPDVQSDEEKVPDAVYNGIEGHFRALGKALSEFLGQLDVDNITTSLKDDHENA